MGVEASCPVARIVMDAWAEEVMELQTKTKLLHQINPIQFEPLIAYHISKYVDDVLAALEEMKLGVRWDPTSKCFTWTQETEDQDKADSKTTEANTMIQFSRMASSLISCLEFTMDCPGNNRNGRMPVLDTSM